MSSNANATTVKVAVVQAGSVPFDPGACVDKAIRLIGQAGATGARVVVFPEAFITGYPKGLNYGLVVGARDAAGREEFRLYLDGAIDVPGPHTFRLGEAAAAHRCYVVIGVIERDLGTCYCTVLFFAPDGALLGKHRKLMPTAGGTDDLGLRRWFHAHGGGYSLWTARLSDLLGELHADAPHGNVFKERRALLRSHGRRAGYVALLDAARRARGTVLRPNGLPVPSEEGLSRNCARVSWRFTGCRANARR